MIRKQLYIRPDQDRALKDVARNRGLSEAELVREALDLLFKKQSDLRPLSPHQQAVEELIRANLELSRAAQPDTREPYQFNRDEIYEERERRWK